MGKHVLGDGGGSSRRTRGAVLAMGEVCFCSGGGLAGRTRQGWGDGRFCPSKGAFRLRRKLKGGRDALWGPNGKTEGRERRSSKRISTQ